MMPQVRKVLRDRVAQERRSPAANSKGRYNSAYALQLWDVYGAYPDVVSHTKEYVPFFQGHGVRPVRPEPIQLFDAEERARQMADRWRETEQYAMGRLGPARFVRETANDHATDVIESMWGGLGKKFFINTANRGAVDNLPADAFLELRCDVDMAGPRPHPAGPMPRGLLAMQHQVLDAHELTAEAAVTGDRAVLRRAMLTDPICNNIGDVDACIRDLLDAERDALPAYWYRRK
jgi:alpha-galactosidase/6-phospho-beta-glucosidase family protein